MTKTHSDGSTPVPDTTQPIRRRGLFAAAWAAVIGLVLKYTTEPVEAAASLQYANTTTPVTNTAFGPTVIIADDTGGYASTGSRCSPGRRSFHPRRLVSRACWAFEGRR
jgi:hypothetical protein